MKKIYNKNILYVNIISAEKKIFSGYVKFIVIPCILGDIGVYVNHTPLISLIKAGIVKIITYNFKNKNIKNNEFIFVFGGFVEIKSNYINILVDIAIRNVHLDKNRAIFSKKFSKKNKNINIKKNTLSLIQAELAIAIARITMFKKNLNKF